MVRLRSEFVKHATMHYRQASAGSGGGVHSFIASNSVNACGKQAALSSEGVHLGNPSLRKSRGSIKSDSGQNSNGRSR